MTTASLEEMSTQPLQHAIAVTRSVMENIQSDQLDQPTPCDEWNVGQVINHIIGAQEFFRAGVAGEQPSQDDTNWAEGDYLAAYDTACDKMLSAYGEEGALQRMLELPFGTMPGAALMGMAVNDTFTHGWDLAKATGQSTDLAPELAAEVLAQSRANIQDAFRNEAGNPFGLEQQAPDGANPADQLAAFLGRTV